MRRVSLVPAGSVAVGIMFSLYGAETQSKIISSVEIFGSAAGFPLKTKSGTTLDGYDIQDDVKTLYRTGRFSDIRVETAPDGGRVRVVFRVEGKHTVRIAKAELFPATPGIKFAVPLYTELDDQGLQQLVSSVRKQLADSGYQNPKVTPELRPAGPGKANLKLHIERGPAMDIRQVTFAGNLGLDPAELRKALRPTRTQTILPGIPKLWNGWHIRPPYNPELLQSEIGNLRSFYYRHGFFDAAVRLGSIETGDNKARVGFTIQSGPRYIVRDFRLAGANGLREIPIQRDGSFPVKNICRALFEERREAQTAGVLDFGATIEVRPALERRDEASLIATIQRGRPYEVGRIEFRGNKTFSDAAIRRAMLLDEGEPMNETLLRRSLARINRSGLFEPLTDKSVIVNTPTDSNRANLTIWVKEKKMRHWLLSGPVGPMSVAGPLQFIIGSRLPSWGQGIFEMATYSANLNFVLLPKALGNFIPFLPNKRFLTIVTVDRPSLPGQTFLSGFTITPQFRWQGPVASYGISQVRTLVSPLFQSKRDFETGLIVNVERTEVDMPGGGSAMACPLSKTKLDWVRQISRVALNLAFSVVPF